MKSIPVLLVATLALAAINAAAQAPTLVRAASGENSRTAEYSAATDYYVENTDSALAGNCFGIFAVWQTTNSPTVTVSDDKSDSFTQVTLINGSSHAGAVWIAPNVSSGAHRIDLHFSAETSYITPITFEVANCPTSNPVDVYAGQESSGTSITSGALGTLAASGELVLQFAAYENTSVPATSSMAAGSQSNITWALKIAELLDGIEMQYGTYNSTASFSPTMSTGTSNGYISIAIAIKTGSSSGSVPSGLRILSQQHVSMFSTADGGPGYNNPSVTQFPCSGNLLVVMAYGGSPITSVAEAGTNLSCVNFGNATYPCSYIGTGASETAEVFYSANHTCNNSNTFSITPNLSYSGTGADYDYTLVSYDLAGAASAPYDTSASTSGDATSGSTVTGPSLTPSKSGELILNMEGEWYGQVESITGSGVLDSDYVEQNGDGSSAAVDQDNGWAHYLDPSTSAVQVTYNLNFAGGGYSYPGYWAAVAVAWQPQGAPPGNPYSLRAVPHFRSPGSGSSLSAVRGPWSAVRGLLSTVRRHGSLQ